MKQKHGWELLSHFDSELHPKCMPVSQQQADSQLEKNQFLQIDDWMCNINWKRVLITAVLLENLVLSFRNL